MRLWLGYRTFSSVTSMALYFTVPSFKRLDGVALIVCDAIRPNAHKIIGEILFQDGHVRFNDSLTYLLFQSGDGFPSPGASLLLLRPSGTAQ
jgi:hypothetical protein